MRGFVSIYLDALRGFAALGVLLWHAHSDSISSGVLPPFYFNHQLVILFFVISGYVIAGSALRPGCNAINYSADRLARLYSVVLPALVLTYVLDWCGARFSPEIYQGIDHRWQSFRFAVNLVNLQQIWTFCVVPSSNLPFWSIGYEFWYYVLFGIWIFVSKVRLKIVFLLLVSLVIGPKVLLLLPAWVAGALAYYATQRISVSARTSCLLFGLTTLLTFAGIFFSDRLGLDNGQVGIKPLYYSANFLGDNLLAVFVGLNFLACGVLSKHLSSPDEKAAWVRGIRWVSGKTFSLYLYHYPILLCLRAVIRYDPRNGWAVAMVIVATLLAVCGLSALTEGKYPTLRALARKWGASAVARWWPVGAVRATAGEPI